MSGLMAAGLAIVGAVGVLNLILTLAVIRRLRGIESRNVDGIDNRALPEAGFRPGVFAVADQDGITVTESDLARGQQTVVVLSASCEPCQDMARQLESDVDALSRGTLVWIVSDAGDHPGADLAGYRVVHSPTSLVEEIFEVRGFPAVLSLVDGVVAEADHRLRVPVG